MKLKMNYFLWYKNNKLIHHPNQFRMDFGKSNKFFNQYKFERRILGGWKK